MRLEDNHKKLSLLGPTYCLLLISRLLFLIVFLLCKGLTCQFKLLVTENIYIFCILWASTFDAVEEEQSLRNPYSLLPFLNQLSSVCYARLLLLHELIIQSTAIKILLYSAIKADRTDSKTCTLISGGENVSKYSHVSSRHLQESCCT